MLMNAQRTRSHHGTMTRSGQMARLLDSVDDMSKVAASQLGHFGSNSSLLLMGTKFLATGAAFVAPVRGECLGTVRFLWEPAMQSA